MGYKVCESHIANRLHNKFAMYKGEPVFLQAKRTGGGYDYPDMQMWGAYVHPDKPNTMFRIDVTEPSFSAALVQYGYITVKPGVLAFIENASSNGYHVKWSINGCGEYLYTSSLARSVTMYDCIMGIHPKFDEAVKQLEKVRAASFDRDFALVKEYSFSDIDIHYKGKMIGAYDPKTNKITLRKGPVMKLIKRKLDKIVGVAA